MRRSLGPITIHAFGVAAALLFLTLRGRADERRALGTFLDAIASV